MPHSDSSLQRYDPEVWQSIRRENARQSKQIGLIASENYVSARVLQTHASRLTNKYAEGYPARRYYGGCRFVDAIENTAVSRARRLFDAEYANVQPHSGSQANFAVYLALLSPRDVILGMALSHGGHLTHGSPVNFSGKLYRSVCYHTDRNGCIDYEEIRRLAERHKPKMIIGGFSSYSGPVDWKKFRRIADDFHCYFMADISHVAGLVASGVYPNPIGHAHVVTATTHKTLSGPRGGIILSKGNPTLYGRIDSAVFPGSQGGPMMHTIAGKAVSFKEALEPQFQDYQRRTVENARSMVRVFMDKGLSVVSHGTNNHLFVVDLRKLRLTGILAQQVLERTGIVVNKNAVPNDPCDPFVTSGIRIGTPSVTRRGMRKTQAIKIAGWICDVLQNVRCGSLVKRIRHEVERLCRQYPIDDGHRIDETGA